MWDAMVNDESPDVETLEREGFLDAADAAIGQIKPTDRPDAHCSDCPFSDRGDWTMYRSEYEELHFDARVALPEAQERFKRAEAEVERLREALAKLRHTASQREFSNEFVGRITRDVLHELGEF
jgi:hypothetical protein